MSINRNKIYQSSNNDPQREYMVDIIDYLEIKTDDIYDQANFIAAMRKAEILIMQLGRDKFQKHGHDPNTFNRMVDHAVLDWKNWNAEMEPGVSP